MITLFFIILLIVVFARILGIAIKAAWGLTKIILTLVMLPVVIIAIALSGFIYLALIILIITGIVSLISAMIPAGR